MPHESPTIAVAVVLHAGSVLVGRRSAAAAAAPGLDEFPGGKIEPGETPAAAAARECLEETGLTVRLLERTLAVSSSPTIVFHWAIPVDATAVPRAPFAWVPIADLARRNFPAANAAVLARLRADSDPHADDHGGS